MTEARSSKDRVNEGSGEQVNLEVRLSDLDRLAPEYVNNVHVNSDASAIQVVFSRIMPPIISGERDRERLKALETIEAVPVARLVMTPLTLQQLISVLRTAQEQYEAHQHDAVFIEGAEGG